MKFPLRLSPPTQFTLSEERRLNNQLALTSNTLVNQTQNEAINTAPHLRLPIARRNQSAPVPIPPRRSPNQLPQFSGDSNYQFEEMNAELPLEQPKTTPIVTPLPGISAPKNHSIPASAALHEDRFFLLENIGGGDCLFHALEGTKIQPSLNFQQINELRFRVAKVLAEKADTIPGNRRNFHEVAQTMLQQGRSTQMLPESISNKEMAKFQARPGHMAGAMELHQWLELPENHHKTVVILDAMPGNELVDVFSSSINQETGNVDIIKKRSSLKSTGPTASLTFEEAKDIVNKAIFDDTSSTQEERAIPSDRVVLYRTAIHFERVLGL